MTHPAKSKAKGVSECNNCGEEFEYVLTYGTGRICPDCEEILDDPSACSYTASAFLLPDGRLNIDVMISHDQPVTVHIPPYETVRLDDENTAVYNGHIAVLKIKDSNGTVIAEEVWKHKRHHVLDPSYECSLNINHDKVLGCDGTRSWEVEINNSEILAEDSVSLIIEFPEIKEKVPQSTIEKTINIPDL